MQEAKKVLIAAVTAYPTDLDLYGRQIDLLGQTRDSELVLYTEKHDSIKQKMLRLR